MKRLILLRHGKSSWENFIPDEKRTLVERAYKDADLVAEAFDQNCTYNFTLWTSKATRAKLTAELVAKKLNHRIDDFQVKDDLYTFNSDKLFSFIQSLPNQVENMMLVGHNPAFTQIIYDLCKDSNIENLSTTGLVEIEFVEDDWKSIYKGKLKLLLVPKKLR